MTLLDKLNANVPSYLKEWWRCDDCGTYTPPSFCGFCPCGGEHPDLTAEMEALDDLSYEMNVEDEVGCPATNLAGEFCCYRKGHSEEFAHRFVKVGP